MQLVAHNGVHISPLQTLKVATKTGGAKALLVGTVPRVSPVLSQSPFMLTMGSPRMGNCKSFQQIKSLHVYKVCDLIVYLCAGDETYSTNSSGMDPV